MDKNEETDFWSLCSTAGAPGAARSCIGSHYYKFEYITVTGNVEVIETFEVLVTSDVSFGTMTPGNTYTNTSTNLTVNSTCTSWIVNAYDNNPNVFNEGKMLSGGTELTQPFMINVDGGTYQPLPFNSILTGGPGITNATIGFQQEVVAGDQPGSYSITILFIGSCV